MLTQYKKEKRIDCSTRGLPGVAYLVLVLLALLVSGGQAAAATGKAEYGLVKMINQYRQQKGLPAIPLSEKLTTVAVTHMEDLVNNKPHEKLCGSNPDKQNPHSWSNNPGKWKGGCYDYDNPATHSIMWDKPYEITGYPYNGFENYHFGGTPNDALQDWKTSTLHNDVILNKYPWDSYKWKAIGAGSCNGHYAVWFSTTLDTSKAPNKIAYLKDYDKPKTANLMLTLKHIDPSKIKLLKPAGGSSGKGKESNVAPSGSRVTTGAHGRVYALDKSGKIIGNVPGATIELKDQGGGMAATVKSGQQGYYKADLAPGQYFYKVTAPGYKDEDKGRGFTIERSDKGHIYDFWLIKGPNDPDKQPPDLPKVEIGKLKGHVWEKTYEGKLVGIPQSAVSLRRNGSAQLANVFTSGADKDGKQAGFYKVVLQAGTWKASVKAPGFEMFVDPKPIVIEAGKEATRDFILRRKPQKPPSNQGIKGIVRVRGQRLPKLPADLKIEIKPIANTMTSVSTMAVDKKGGFRKDLLPGSYRVLASAKGYKTADSGAKFVFAGKYTMVELWLVPELVPEKPPEKPPERPTEMRLMLTVVEDSPRKQRPLPEAKLLVRRSNQGLGEAQRGTSDENGRAEFTIQEPGSYMALAQAEGFQPSGVKLVIAPGASVSKTIKLTRRDTTPPIEQAPGRDDGHEEEAEPVEVAGYVIYENAESPTGAYGVAEARLIWQPLGGRGGRAKSAATGETGDFKLVLPEGDYRVGFKLPPDFHAKAPETVKVRVGMGKKWFHVLKAPQRDPDDGNIEPGPGNMDPPDDDQQEQVDVRGAVVVQSAQGRDGYAGVRGAVVEWHPRGDQNARPGSTRSGRGGAFSLRLGSGEYVAEVVPPAGYEPTTKVVRVHSGMQRTLLVLRRTPADTDRTPEDPDPGPGGGGIEPPPDQGNLTMSVQVFGRDGRKTFPLGAAQVRISGRRQMFMTDSGGQLRVPLPTGRYNVTATKSGFSMGGREIMLSRHNTSVPPIYLDRQPAGGGGGGGGGGGIKPPPPQHAVPLQIRVLVSFPKSPQKGGWATTPAKGANIRVMQGRQQVFSGSADGNGYVGTKLKPGNYQIQVSHGNMHHNEGVNIGNQGVRKTITLKSGAAVMTPGTGPARIIPGLQNRGRITPGAELQRRVR